MMRRAAENAGAAPHGPARIRAPRSACNASGEHYLRRAPSRITFAAGGERRSGSSEGGSHAAARHSEARHGVKHNKRLAKGLHTWVAAAMEQSTQAEELDRALELG